jgi:hypothetical protein
VIEVEEEDEGAEEEEEIEEFGMIMQSACLLVVKEEVGSVSGVGSFKAPGKYCEWWS